MEFTCMPHVYGCLIKAIVHDNAKHKSFVLAEGTLSKSSARANLSDVAQHRSNASRVALSYVNAAEIKRMGLAKGHTPPRATTHKDNELTEQKHKKILHHSTL